jgi:hypothetical protein
MTTSELMWQHPTTYQQHLLPALSTDANARSGEAFTSARICYSPINQLYGP